MPRATSNCGSTLRTAHLLRNGRRDAVSEPALPSVNADLGGLRYAVIDGQRPSEMLQNPGQGTMRSPGPTVDRRERGRELPFSLSSDSGSRSCTPSRCAAVRPKSYEPVRPLGSAGSDTASAVVIINIIGKWARARTGPRPGDGARAGRTHNRTFASRQGEGVGTPSAFRIALAGSR